MDYDVFLSYAREDAARAAVVRDKLEALGLKVFFDAEGIDSGEEFPVVIDRAVKGSRCVLGLWSRTALESRWVRIESRIGLDGKKLVAAMLDATPPEALPAEFYNVNFDSLADFRGQEDHQGWRRVLRAIWRRVGRGDLAPGRASASSASAQPAHPPTAQAGNAQPAAPSTRMPLLIGAGAVAVLALALLFANPFAQRPTQIEEPAVADIALTPAPAAAAPAPATTAPVAPAAPAAPALADLSGSWRGYYEQNGTRTPFTLLIDGEPGAFRGRMTERADFGDGGSPNLYAEIRGRAGPGGEVAFVKTYDGTGGQTHSVEYAGRLEGGGDAVNGAWSLPGAQGGFYMARD